MLKYENVQNVARSLVCCSYRSLFFKSIVPSTAKSFSSFFYFVSLTFVVVAICDLQFLLYRFPFSFSSSASADAFLFVVFHFHDSFHLRYILIFYNIAWLRKWHAKQRIQFPYMSHSSKLNWKHKKNADERRQKKCGMENTDTRLGQNDNEWIHTREKEWTKSMEICEARHIINGKIEENLDFQRRWTRVKEWRLAG